MSPPTAALTGPTSVGAQTRLEHTRTKLREFWVGLKRLRWPAALGATLAAIGLAVALCGVPALQEEEAALAQKTQAVRSRIAHAAKTPATPPPGRQVLVFRDGFPGAADRQQRVAALLQAARATGLSPLRTEFRYEADPAAGLARYRVALPLEGDYTQLRAFLARALSQDTALSLDSVRLRRPHAQQLTLQAELAFTFFMRTGAGDTEPKSPPTSVTEKGRELAP